MFPVHKTRLNCIFKINTYLSRAFIFISLILCQIPGTLSAQVYSRARNITVTEGLSDNRVTCFYKDREGFMWIGTRNGLNRYDGHSFRVFRPGSGNTIRHEVINDITGDSRGRIWVATMEGISIFDPAMDQWTYILPDPGNDRNAIPNPIVWDIYIDGEDRAWIVCDVFDLTVYDIRKGSFRFYGWKQYARTDPAFKDGGYRSIQKIVPGRAGEYWLGTNRGLVQLETTSGVFTFRGGGYNGNVTDLHYDRQHGKVYLSSQHGVRRQFDEHTGYYSELNPQAEPYPSGYFENRKPSQIWMADGSGLLKIDPSQNKAVMRVHIPQLSGSLLPGGVNTVYEDELHNRWVGTANGISVYNREEQSSSFIPLLPVSDRAAENEMGGAYFDRRSGTYFVCALNKGAVFVFSRDGGPVSKISTDDRGRKLDACMMIRKDNNDSLWLLTATHVYRYQRGRGTFAHFPTPNQDREVVFRDLMQDPAGHYWFASFHDGIYFYNGQKKSFEEPPVNPSARPNNVTGIAWDNQGGEILLGTFGIGVMALDPRSGQSRLYAPASNAPDYAQLLLVNSMDKDEEGRIWLGTETGGVYRYHPGFVREKAFSNFNMRSGLDNNNILSLCSDATGHLWLLTGSGISSIDTSGRFRYRLSPDESFGFTAYGSDSRYPHPAYFNTTDREFLVAVGGGLLRYPVSFNQQHLRFPLVLTAIRADGRPVKNKEAAAPARSLPFRSNTLQFDFAALYYGTVSLQYEYRLDGFETGWKPALAYSVSYQNLPPGSYRFQVRAKNRDGEIVAALTGPLFRVVSPVWLRWWFLGLLVLLFVSAGFIIIRSLRRKLHLERIVNAFATSLYGQNTTEDILWDTAKNCIDKLGFVDCVIYQLEEPRNVLIQKAAYGPKNPRRREIINMIEIRPGEGIVGTVAATGKAVMISNTARDKRYIVDDEIRLSEITVPVIVDGKVFAVIDSEHPSRGFFRRFHLRVLKKIAAICSERILKYLTEERLRAKIARDLHDEMGSTLTSINIISKVAMEAQPDSVKAKEYFQKIKDHSGKMMESMSDMVWAINPVNDNVGRVLLRMKEFAAEILEPARISYFFEDRALHEEITLNPEQRKNIYLVFKEALSNVVKYSQATEVNIIFSMGDGMLRMQIADNGKGFQTTLETSGNGLQNMRARAMEMRGQVQVESVPGTGTSVTLLFPVT